MHFWDASSYAFFHFGPRVRKRGSDNLDTRFTLKSSPPQDIFIHKNTLKRAFCVREETTRSRVHLSCLWYMF